MRPVTLYHFPPSLCSQKVRLALEEKGVPWRGELVDIGPALENYEPEYMRLNPRGVVPTLVDDGEVITDSARIVRYIDRHFDGPALLPEAPEQAAEVERWIDLQDDYPLRELSYGQSRGALAGLMKVGNRRRLQRLADYYERYPELADLYAAKYEDIDALRRVSADPGAQEVLRRGLEGLLDELEQALTARGPFLIGQQYTLADVVWSVFLARVHMLGLAHLWQEGTRPKVENYFHRLRLRPSWQRADLWDRPHPAALVPVWGPRLAPVLLGTAAVAGAGLAFWMYRRHRRQRSQPPRRELLGR